MQALLARYIFNAEGHMNRMFMKRLVVSVSICVYRRSAALLIQQAEVV